jgi:hypothetical protein
MLKQISGMTPYEFVPEDPHHKPNVSYTEVAHLMSLTGQKYIYGARALLVPVTSYR